MFEAVAIGHPLLPADTAVCNDVALDERVKLFVVSGSNMSGKSTLLRTVGVNTVLALAGAPVFATSLRISPLQIGASLRTQDSLQGGVSRFYAEIMRLRQIVEIAERQPPLLFLLDEILHGTNSHDRLIGAEAIAAPWSDRAQSGLSPRTTWRWRGSRRTPKYRRPTFILRTSWWRAGCRSTIACAPASSRRATRWS